MISYRYPSICLRCYCGIFEDEQQFAQDIVISLTLHVNKKLNEVQQLEDTVDYFDFMQKFLKRFDMHKVATLEEFALQINEFVRDYSSMIHRIHLIIRKNLPLAACPMLEFEGEYEL